MPSIDTVRCEYHGDQPGAFVCSHLLSGQSEGFHFEAGGGTPHPDAWCSVCERVRAEHGGDWNDASEALIEVRLVCGVCYDEIKLKCTSNVKSRTMSQDEFRAFCHAAHHQLMDLNASCEQQFSIGHWDRWDYDAREGTITFSEAGVPKVIAAVQQVGTTSARSGTWLWAWANDSVPRTQSFELDKVRSFGEAESLPLLTEPSCADDESLGWEMTAVTAKIIGGKGGYRAPRENGGYSYYVYTELRFADQPGSRPN